MAISLARRVSAEISHVSFTATTTSVVKLKNLKVIAETACPAVLSPVGSSRNVGSGAPGQDRQEIVARLCTERLVIRSASFFFARVCGITLLSIR